VIAKIAYRLTEIATGSVVYERSLATEGTVTYFGCHRAVRANLRLLVGDLYALPDR
jgi:hypothetical protein